MRAALLALCTLALYAADLAAQKTELERADSLLAAGETTRAAALLKQWQQAHANDNNPHALYLAAQLEPTAELARELYVSIALSHPTSRYAPPALLRLGQLSHSTGDWQRAIGYLERLRSDYPNARERESGYLWLVRAYMTGGRNAEACSIAGTALRGEVRDPALNDQVRTEERRACGAANATPAPTPEASNPPKPEARPEPNPETRTEPNPETRTQSRAAARFAVQAGAFKAVSGANAVASGLKKAGFDARVTQLDGTSLNHVRVGFFATRAEAAAMVQRMKDAGFNALIVDDVAREK